MNDLRSQVFFGITFYNKRKLLSCVKLINILLFNYLIISDYFCIYRKSFGWSVLKLVVVDAVVVGAQRRIAASIR